MLDGDTTLVRLNRYIRNGGDNSDSLGDDSCDYFLCCGIRRGRSNRSLLRSLSQVGMGSRQMFLRCCRFGHGESFDRVTVKKVFTERTDISWRNVSNAIP